MRSLDELATAEELIYCTNSKYYIIERIMVSLKR